MRVRFSEFANNELADARDWYERQQAGLGLRFKGDVREAALQIASRVGWARCCAHADTQRVGYDIFCTHADR